jgi:hypothetical protein
MRTQKCFAVTTGFSTNEKNVKTSKGKLQAVNGRTDNAMAKRIKTKRQTTRQKTEEQHIAMTNLDTIRS